jgi:penicillin-binding protein 2
MEDKRGAVVIMDPYSGEIVSLSSNPNYDPNDFVKREEGVINDLLQDEHSPLFNRAISGQFPPGSIFKIVTLIAALEKDQSLINRFFTCNGGMQIGDRNFKCSSIHDSESLRDAIVHSCNVYFYNLGILIGPEIINKYAHMLGLGRATGVDLDYETKGFIPSPNWKKIIRLQTWYKGDTANMSIGQGEILVTPLQMMRLISIFVNGGELVQPHLIKAIGGKQIDTTKNKIVKLSENNLKEINSYLYDVVSDPEGTANIAKIEGLKIYGKTGTAQVPGKESHGWLLGYVAKDKPGYAFCVFLENAGSSHAACLVAKKILTEMLNQDLI